MTRGRVAPEVARCSSFTFDALGRHATRVTPSATDTYGYVGATELVWQVANASLTTNSAIDAAGNRNAVKPGATVGLTVADLHGSVAAELGAGGSSILAALRYDPYGLVAPSGSWDSGGSFANPWRYQGRLDLSPDPDNERYDFGARDYLPTAGVFASLDTYAGQALDPRSMNRFLYAEANPTTLIDPSGHMAEETTAGVHTLPVSDPEIYQVWEANKAASTRLTSARSVTTAGAHGVRDENALEATLAQPRQRWHYEGGTGLSEFAAALAHGLVKDHPYIDGKERIALVTLVAFLDRNEIELTASNAEAISVMLALAADEMSEGELATWIGAHSRPLGR